MSTRVKIGLGIILLPIVGFLYYAISPLFRTTVADDPLPGLRETPVQEAMLPPQVLSSPAGSPVVGTPGHPAEGTVRIVEADGKRYLRYENFKTINGPDLFVYLAKDLQAQEFVNLGPLKATEGNINYEIPAEIDPSQYRYALTWCRAFGVLFNQAVLPSN